MAIKFIPTDIGLKFLFNETDKLIRTIDLDKKTGKNVNKNVDYKKVQVYSRQQDLCYFCNEIPKETILDMVYS